MKYGASRDYDDEDLGKFGIGLKTCLLYTSDAADE